jgi:Fic family protein
MPGKRPKPFSPIFAITSRIANALMRIEAIKQAVGTLPINPRVLATLRESARLFSTHYSTMIEGNRLTRQQVADVIEEHQHFPGRERDQNEVQGYYAALDAVDDHARRALKLSELALQKLHALVMAGGKTRIKATPYRDGQNVIREAGSRRIIYLPPEAKDVPMLMRQLIEWLNTETALPVPIKAAIAHYQYATIHPYYDGNGRTARLLATLVLHLGGYDLKGLYALEEYYARNLSAYYRALTVGSSHNYYGNKPAEARARTDITAWVEYFITGMLEAFENVHRQAEKEARRGGQDWGDAIRNLDAKQRKALTLFRDANETTARQIAKLFRYQPRTAALLCQRWVKEGFLQPTNPSKKARRYALAVRYRMLGKRQSVRA